ncbi:DUF7008 domain-containing protein [Streptosporangium canum]|uniref:DUF7008 domain-containing protein n=1 Tax=Streptosporangium canum TaxID=324952 RepID=UPI0037B2977D
MEQAQALATLTVDREQSHGWDARRLAPLLAGLREVLPWVRRWHDDFDPMYGSTLGRRRSATEEATECSPTPLPHG